MSAITLPNVNGDAVKKIPLALTAAIQSTLLLFCLLFLLRFMGLILHEGGHALYLLLRGFAITLYVHPFAFSGYARPMVDFSVWTHVSGSAVAIPAALLISLPFWKRRSLSNLPFLMLFPWVAFNDGMYMLQRPSILWRGKSSLEWMLTT